MLCMLCSAEAVALDATRGQCKGRNCLKQLLSVEMSFCPQCSSDLGKCEVCGIPVAGVPVREHAHRTDLRLPAPIDYLDV